MRGCYALHITHLCLKGLSDIHLWAPARGAPTSAEVYVLICINVKGLTMKWKNGNIILTISEEKESR